jgi:hypothetical protein
VESRHGYILENLIEESKSLISASPYGRIKKDADFKKARSKKNFKSSRRLRAKKAKVSLEKELKSFLSLMRKNIRSYMMDKLSFSRLKSKSSIIFKETVSKIFQLGTQSAGLIKANGSLYDLTLKDREWVKSYVREESKHFNKFLSKVRTKNISFKEINRRTKNYSESLRSVFESSHMMTIGKDTVIYWTLESDDPCVDCRELARNNPYTADTLPTTPKAGDTICHNHCYCTLRTEEVDVSVVRQIRRTKTKAFTRGLLKRLKQQTRKKK